MRCPTLAELPAPPPGKTGWPWTTESPRLPDTMPDGSPWPRISIVTPSYNQGQFIEETIRSVLLQGYPDMECIIMDGGSSDDSVDIIKRYSQWLTSWVSEADRGQSHAINKGFERATGSWGNWINSDDVLLPNALSIVAEIASSAAPGTEGICLGCRIVNYDRSQQFEDFPLTPVRGVGEFLRGGLQPMAQPATFCRLSHFRVHEKLHFVMDWVLYFSMIERNGSAFAFDKRPIVEFRLHDNSKTVKQSHIAFLKEQIEFLRSHSYLRLSDCVICTRWYRLRLARMLYSPEGAGLRDCLRALVRFPEVIFDRMLFGRLRRILLGGV